MQVYEYDENASSCLQTHVHVVVAEVYLIEEQS